MPNPHPKPGQATAKFILIGYTFPPSMVRIKTIHDQCQGIWDSEQDNVNENLHCEIQNEQVILDLARVTLNDLVQEVDWVIGQGGFHGLEHGQDVSYVYLSFEYVFYDNFRAPLSLENIPDQELRRVFAWDEGYVEVVWDF